MATKEKSSTKKVTKKSTTKKSVASTPTVKIKKAAKKSLKISKAYTKPKIYTELSSRTDTHKKDVVRIFDKFTNIIAAHMKKGGPQKFVMPGLLKMTVNKVPAKKARKGINPFTKEPTIFKAKPASQKVNALKLLKEMAN